MEIILYCLIAFVLGFAIAWLTRKASIDELRGLRAQLATFEKDNQRLQTDKDSLLIQLEAKNVALTTCEKQLTTVSIRFEAAERALQEKKEELAVVASNLSQINKDFQGAEREIFGLKKDLQNRNEQLAKQKEDLESIGQQFTNQFKVLAQNILDEKTKVFNTHQEQSLASILNPLKENITNFKTEFEAKYTKESEDRISLREQIRHMMDLNQTLSVQANNLTNALRGQVKQQGNWGEMILISILEYADLQKDIHYFVQPRLEGDEGEALQPDVIVRYPDERCIVIDSKVSLLHYEQYCAATDLGQQNSCLQLLLQSMYRHIDGLSGKKYAEAAKALDFVILFVPVEGAYITVMQSDREMWQYAYKKRVLLISPTNLIAAMKIVHDMWKRDGINQNAQEIAAKAVKIYEKLAAFIEDFEKVGAQLDRAAGTFSDARRKLHTGKGNVVRLAEGMKRKILHTKPTREFPPEMLEQAMLDNDHDDESEQATGDAERQ